MHPIKQSFAQRLREALEAAGYPARPAVLEREFNTRYWGKPMTLHGVRRWLQGETMPGPDKLAVLAEWLGVTPQELGFGAAVTQRVQQRRARWEAAWGYQERELFELFLGLPVTNRRVVREVILAFAQAQSAAEQPGSGRGPMASRMASPARDGP
ncbi:MAG: hypothetical protein RI988_3615 [Pseudomonadota bacterium]